MRTGLPAGYVVRRERGAEVVALPSVIEPVLAALAAAGTLHGWAAAQPGARAFTGRGTAWATRLAHEACVVRHYRRGGAVARLLGDRYLRAGTPRPLREVHAAALARQRGVATPEVLAAVIRPAGVFYRADLATRLVPDARSLADLVLAPGRAGDAGRLEAWRATGVLLRAAFAAGLEHADLNLRNVLVQQGDGSSHAWLLDLDRATVHEGAVGTAGRQRMLARLHRSRRKLERAFGTSASEAELAAFHAALAAA